MNPNDLRYVDLEILENGNLRVTPTERAIAEKDSILAMDQKNAEYTLLEYQCCNGWTIIQPEEIGALTDAMLLTDEYTIGDDNTVFVGRAWSDIDFYQIRSWIEEMYEKGEVTLPLKMEANILYESSNFYAYKVPGGVDVRLLDGTHSLSLGVCKDLDHAIRFITKAERYPQYLKYLRR